MKSFIVFAALVAIAVALPSPQNPDAQAETLKNESDNIGTGNFKSEYETSNEIKATEEGELRQGTDGPFLVKRGSFSFRAADGIVYTVDWVADENGFQATGVHIPKPLY